MTEKDVKSCFCKKNDFDQRTTCRAPIGWSKYTTDIHTFTNRQADNQTWLEKEIAWRQ